jgi:hypothetical protein
MGWLLSGFNGLIALAAAVAIAFGGGAYMGSKYRTNYYEAKIAKDKEMYQQALAESKAKFDDATAEYFQQIKQEQAKNAYYTKQVKNLYTVGSPNCNVTYGFIRLYNDSASGSSSDPKSTDNLTSEVDLATVLTTDIENHGKYREAAAQIEALKAGNSK